MKTILIRLNQVALALFATALLGGSATGQLLNEIESDPPNEIGDRCQYVEILGTPAGTVPSNTYFISINSDADNFGFVNIAVDISGQTYGSNGTLTLVNNFSGQSCPNRTFDAGTTLMSYSSPRSLGQTSEGFYIVNSGGSMIQGGTDLDSDDNGTIDSGLTGGFTFIDGINFIFNPQEQWKYGPGPNLVENLLGDVPDAATRFPGNTSANDAAAWYSGDLADTPEETVTYASGLSSNFPSGGMLTPGGINAGVANSGSALFDFDGDGKTDVSIFRPAPAEWWYLRSSDGGNAAAQFGATTDVITPADYTGDGKADIAFFRPSTAEWFILRSEDSSFYAFPFGASGDIPAPGDFDADGKADPTVYRPSTSEWFTLRSTDGGATIQTFGIAGDQPVVGDYDGDGADDIGIYRPSVSEWWINRSTDGLLALQFGTTGDQTVNADYTGDGRTDVAFFRPGSGEWFILRSEDFSFFSFPFGAAGDVPAPGDYDGDGMADATVFRPSTSTWFSNQTTSGVTVTGFGAAGDVPVPNAYVTQ